MRMLGHELEFGDGQHYAVLECGLDPIPIDMTEASTGVSVLRDPFLGISWNVRLLFTWLPT
jgi:hypothetical protein